MNAEPFPNQPFVIEHAAFSARETELTWSFAFGYDAVWEAVNSAATRLGLTVLSADRKVGLSVLKPAFSLLNVGRRIAITFLKLDKRKTLVRGLYLHGVMCLESRHSRQQTLDALFRTALLALDKTRPAPQPERPAPKPSPSAAEQQATQQAAPKADTSGIAPAKATAQADATASPQPQERQARPQTPADRTTPGKAVDLESLDFRNVDFDSLPLTPPTGSEAGRYRMRPPLQRESGLAKAAGWFALGLGIAILAFILADGLSLLLK